MFILIVTKDDKIIARRETNTASACVEKFVHAMEYFRTTKEFVLIQMLRHDGAVIISRYSTEEL